MRNKSKVQSLMQSHSFLLRIVACILIIGCIPLLYSAFSISRLAHDSLMSELEQTAKTSATSMTLEVDEMLENFEVITHHFAENTDTYLYSQGNKNFSAAKLQQYLYNIQTSLPVLVQTCIYYVSSRQVYSASGLMQVSQICRSYFPDMTPDDFFAAMEHVTQPALLVHHGANLAYLVPASIQPNSPNRRIAIYILGNETLGKALALYLPASFRWAGLYDAHDQPAYAAQGFENLLLPDFQAQRDGMEQDVLYVKGDGDARYRIVIAASQDQYMKRIRSFGDSMQRSTLQMLVVCFVLVGSAVWITYRPVRRMLHFIPSDVQNDYGIQDEFTTIQMYIDDQQAMQVELRREAQEQGKLYRDRIFEKLLYGIRISPEAEYVVTDSGVLAYCVGVASLHAVPAVRPLLESFKSQEDLLLLELYDTGHLAALLFFKRTLTEKELEKRQQELREQLDFPIAFGPACGQLIQLHDSYIHAASSLGDTHFSPKSSEDIALESLGTELLLALKGDSSHAEQVVKQVFDCLETQYPSILFKQYAFSTFTQRFQNALRHHYPNVEFRFSEHTDQWRSADVQTQFEHDLQMAMSAIKTQSRQEHARLVDYVNAHMRDPYFSLSDVAQLCNVTEYTASRIFKEAAGQSFKKYITAKRIALAKELLRHTDQRIVDIAQQCGFASASYFARIFKSVEDVTPASYRQEHQA